MSEHTYFSFMLSPNGTLFRMNNQTGETWFISGITWYKVSEEAKNG